MNIRLFRRIVREIEAKNPYFQYKPNAVGAMGFDCMHKSVVAMRMLAYGCPADSLDEKFCMAESMNQLLNGQLWMYEPLNMLKLYVSMNQYICMNRDCVSTSKFII